MHDGIITFTTAAVPTGPPATFNVIAIDNGTSTPYFFNSTPNTVIINPDPVVILPPGNTVDLGIPVTLTADAFLGTRPYSSYSWYVDGTIDPSQTGPTYTFTPSATSSVFVTVTDSLGVTSTNLATTMVTVNPLPTISIAPSATSILIGSSVSFTNITLNGTGPYTYNYTVNDNSGVTISGNTMTFTNAGVYSVMESVTDSDGITANSPAATITVLLPPNRAGFSEGTGATGVASPTGTAANHDHHVTNAAHPDPCQLYG